ncbi:MAG: methyltransferase domain-containing protein [Pseudomonadota bacterium]|nr:methyltransferase domain-containing protein [Pseudomonadota bacterium]
MYQNTINFSSFYATPLGGIAQRIIESKISEYWPNTRGMNVLGIGFSGPYLNILHSQSERSVSVAPTSELGCSRLESEKNRTCIAKDLSLPFSDLSFDRILVIHSLEFSEAVQQMLREIWRILSEGGRLIIIVPNRRGLWSLLESTPFGFGQPYSTTQLARLLDDNMFVTLRSSSALFMPPFKHRMFFSSSMACEKAGKICLPTMGGVAFLEATKQIYAGTTASAVTKNSKFAAITGQ